MGGLIIIIPILAFDIWLSCTTGWRQIRRWVELGQWRPLAATGAASLVLAIALPFLVKYNWSAKTRVEGFPIPLVFFHLDDNGWTHSGLPSFLPAVGLATDIITGLALPFIPFKVAEFLKTVKAELK